MGTRGEMGVQIVVKQFVQMQLLNAPKAPSYLKMLSRFIFPHLLQTEKTTMINFCKIRKLLFLKIA